MAVEIVRRDLSAEALRQIACRVGSVAQSRRILVVAPARDGLSRTDAAGVHLVEPGRAEPDRRAERPDAGRWRRL